FHVFNWLRLDRKISCLPSRNRNQTGRGAEEEAFHHLHSNLHCCPVGGFRPWPGGLHPLEGPLRPQKPARSLHSPKTPNESTWGSPPRRTVTVADGFRGARKKCPTHSLLRTISERCCVKNTQGGQPLTARMSSNFPPKSIV